MSLFPKIQSPCPYKGKFADIMQGNQCRMCKREVVDLTEMTSHARQDFLSACETEVCVSYRVGAKSALVAMAMGAATVPSAAAAQDSEEPSDGWFEHSEGNFIIVGGMRKPQQAEWVEVERVEVDKAVETRADAEVAPETRNAISGGARKPDQTEWVSDDPVAPESDEKPELPVEYDDEPLGEEDTPAAR